MGPPVNHFTDGPFRIDYYKLGMKRFVIIDDSLPFLPSAESLVQIDDMLDFAQLVSRL